MDQGRSTIALAHRGARWRAGAGRGAWLACALFLPCFGGFVYGESDAPPPDALRVRGILDRDTLWSGHVLITDDASVLGATLTIAAGTVIEFAAAPNKTTGPTLTIGSETGLPGWLTVTSTHDRPIVVRTREGRPNGAIVIHARSLDQRRRATGSDKNSFGLELAHFAFEGLGSADHPAVELILRDPDNSVEVYDCTFDLCGRLRVVETCRAEADISHNRMTRTVGTVALEFDRSARFVAAPTQRPQAARSGESSLTVHENQVAGVIRADGVPIEIRDNVLIGAGAGVLLEGDSDGRAVLQNNYVHRKSKRVSDGGSCLDCRDPSANILNNVFRGGSVVVARGSKVMSHNVMIAAMELTTEQGRRVPIGAIVDELPPGATFQHNMLMGPADTMLRIRRPRAALRGDRPSGKRDDDGMTIIRNNTFDGGAVGSRGIVFADASSYEVYDNVFLSTFPAVVDETLGVARVRMLDFNARDTKADQAYRKVRLHDGATAGTHDVQISPGSLVDRTGLLQSLGELEKLLTGEQIDAATVYIRIRSSFAPPAGSPVIAAGRPRERDVRGTIGAMEP